MSAAGVPDQNARESSGHGLRADIPNSSHVPGSLHPKVAAAPSESPLAALVALAPPVAPVPLPRQAPHTSQPVPVGRPHPPIARGPARRPLQGVGPPPRTSESKLLPQPPGDDEKY